MFKTLAGFWNIGACEPRSSGRYNEYEFNGCYISFDFITCTPMKFCLINIPFAKNFHNKCQTLMNNSEMLEFCRIFAVLRSKSGYIWCAKMEKKNAKVNAYTHPHRCTCNNESPFIASVCVCVLVHLCNEWIKLKREKENFIHFVTQFFWAFYTEGEDERERERARKKSNESKNKIRTYESE